MRVNQHGKFMNIILLILLSIVMFFLGTYWRKLTIGNTEKFETISELEMQISPGKIGFIPSGVILYKFREFPETTTYFLFVNLKEKNCVTAYADDSKFNLVAPITAYPQK